MFDRTTLSLNYVGQALSNFSPEGPFFILWATESLSQLLSWVIIVGSSHGQYKNDGVGCVARKF